MDALNTSSGTINFTDAPILAFSWYDYMLFIIMIVSSTLVGVYFGCFGTKQSTKSEYLMGDKKMKPLPVAISLVASNTSTVFLLSLPADVYQFGAGYLLSIFSIILLTIITIYVYLPVFFNLQSNTTYEYLEKRFDKRSRLFASLLFIVACVFYLSVIIYGAALAIAAVTDIDARLITPIVCTVCIFYTAIGGLKAVIWTDTLQFTITTITFVTILILGMQSAGGLSTVWNKAIKGERLHIFNFDPDPTKRDSFWIILIGVTLNMMSYTTVDQSFVQKFLSVGSFRGSVLSVIFYSVGIVIFIIIGILTGLTIYVTYADCDLLTTKIIETNDQLVPYYVMDVAKNIPGLAGLFTAGLFSAALSALSAILNCTTGAIYEDFLSKCLKKNLSQKSVSRVLKAITLFSGLVIICMVFAVEHLGNIFPLLVGWTGLTGGSILGMFTIGVLSPRANAKGAFYGAIGSLIVTSSIGIPAKYYEIQGILTHTPKPISTSGCVLNETIIFSETETVMSAAVQPHFIFRISFYYYTLIGTVCSIVFGLIISYCTNKNDPPVDKTLLSPVIHFLLPKENKIMNTAVQYNSVEQALENLVANSN